MKFDSTNFLFFLRRKYLFLLSFLLSASFFYEGIAGEVDPRAVTILEKARNHIAKESALNNVKALRFKGRLINEQGDTGMIEIIVELPYRQLQLVTMNGQVTEYGLNDYEAWRKIYKIENPDDYLLIPGNVDQLKRARANTFENLKFFSPETNYFRKIEYLGRSDHDGVEVEKVRVRYGAIFFDRHFATSNGDLVYSEIESGEQIREEGEVFVDGIRFPKSVTTHFDGQQRSYVEFDVIEVNPLLDKSLFTLPPLPGLKKK